MEPGDRLLARVAPLCEADRALLEPRLRGEDTVVELTDEATLSRMWDSPEALPSMPELEEPRLWLARSA